MDTFIDNNYELIYNKYCEVYPERIHSDWTLEDAQDLEEFILTYLEEEYMKGEN